MLYRNVARIKEKILNLAVSECFESQLFSGLVNVFFNCITINDSITVVYLCHYRILFHQLHTTKHASINYID